jgi:hypothetical protein
MRIILGVEGVILNNPGVPEQETMVSRVNGITLNNIGLYCKG